MNTQVHKRNKDYKGEQHKLKNLWTLPNHRKKDPAGKELLHLGPPNNIPSAIPLTKSTTEPQGKHLGSYGISYPHHMHVLPCQMACNLVSLEAESITLKLLIGVIYS